MKIQQTIIRFPEMELLTRDSAKLRGFFGNFFMKESPLLHNHFEDGSLRYKYPLVQYKVINKVPHLIGFEEGAVLLQNLFLKIPHIDIDSKVYEINYKNITVTEQELFLSNDNIFYNFTTLWIALNQNNFKEYLICNNVLEKQMMLEKILTGNILSFYKAFDFRVTDKINVRLTYEEKETHYKNKDLIGFNAKFVTNAVLPNFIGLGKAVSRGYGTIIKA